jgi:peptidyl-prolyl cis-trans isomerase C
MNRGLTMTHKLLLAALISLASVVPALAQGVAQAAAVPSAALKVNGVAIAQAKLEAALRQAMANGAKDTPELRTALKSQLIALELFRQEAEKQNFGADADVQAAAAAGREGAMVQKYLLKSVKPNPVTEEQVKAQYEKIVAALGPQEYKTRIIQVADEATAKLITAELKGGKSFEDLAKQHSKLPSAKQGGAIDWVSFKTPLKEGETQGYPLALAQAVTLLKPGMVNAEPIAFNGRFFFVKVDESRATQIPQYEQVKPALARLLQQKEVERASAAFVADLIRRAKIEQ